MIIIAACRNATLGADLVWLVFLEYVECCIAISMVSFTAFRSLFVYDGSRDDAQGARQWYYYPKKLWIRNTISRQEHEMGNHHVIPSETFTGMRTFIRGSPRITSWEYGRSDEVSETSPQTDARHIKVTHDISSEVENVSDFSLATLL